MTAHAIARAKERYGLDLTHADIAAWRDQIRSGRSMRVRAYEGGGVVHVVRHGALALVVVWIAATQAIPTVLPADALASGKTVRRRAGWAQAGRWRRVGKRAPRREDVFAEAAE